MTRFVKIAWIALLFAGTILVIWSLLRPAPRAGQLTSLRGVICTPSRRLYGYGPEPEFQLMPLLGNWVQLHPSKALPDPAVIDRKRIEHELRIMVREERDRVEKEGRK